MAAWGGAALLVALTGAFVIGSRISRPLRNLTRAALMVGSGRTPPVQEEKGPQEIAVVARAFNRMAGELARTDADRALILAGVSHDLRTPLARLRLGIEMSGAPSGEVLAMVADIEEMDRIIGQFLDFGRGDSQEPAQPVDTAGLARDVTEPYRLRGLDVRIDAPDTLVTEARALPLRRSLSNLIDNALRYAGEDKPIDVQVYSEDKDVCIEVADRGPGIPLDQVERMRHPFTRLEEARSNTKGAGLGLAIVDRVMRSHHGRLDLLPREGGGLRAILRLPRTGGSPTRPAPPGDSARALMKGGQG